MKTVKLLNSLLQRLIGLEPDYPWLEIFSNSNLEDFYLLINKAYPDIHIILNTNDFQLDFSEEGDPDIEPHYLIIPRADLGYITFHIYID